MRTIIQIASICLALSAFAGSVLAEGLTRVADNVYTYAGVRNGSPANSFGANAGIVIGRDGIVVIDTLVSAKEAQRFFADIRKITVKPIRYVINTHYHLDHAWGNSEFVKQGAVGIAQTADGKTMERNGPEALKGGAAFGLTPEALEGTEIVIPQISFSERMAIDLGDERIELIHPAPSHTAGSLLVYLPGKHILFAGDILFTDYHPYLAEGDLSGWIKTLEQIEAMDVETIIPGHGPLSAKGDIVAMKSYLAVFDAKARELAAASTDLDVIAAELKKQLPPRSEGEFLIKANLGRYLKPEQPQP